MRRNHPLIKLFMLSWFGFLALACNLASSSVPPTIVPRMTDTPLPTIAYATLAPEELPAQQSAPNPTTPLNGDLTDLLNLVESDRLLIHVDALMNFQTRHVNSPNHPTTGIRAAYEYIRGEFEKIRQNSNGNFQVTPLPFILNWNGLETQQYNIIGLIPGQAIGGGVIVIGAHYDSVSLDWNDGSSYAPGANDNASGVAALIELARILSTRPHRATIMLVAFSAEEVGRQGSQAFVRYLKDRNIQIDAMFSLDIIGSSTGPNGEVIEDQIRLFSSGPNEGVEMSKSRALARAVQFYNTMYFPTMRVIMEDAQDRLGRYSDHMSFNDAGFPAVRFIEPMEDLKRQHTPNDTIDDVQPTYLARSTKVVLAAVTALADGPPPPNQLVLRSNNQGTRTLVWEPSPGAASYRVALRRPGGLTFLPNESFAWMGNSVDWEGFVPTLFAGVVVFAVDENGLMGPPSQEIIIP
jgi:hypothetical protein